MSANLSTTVLHVERHALNSALSAAGLPTFGATRTRKAYLASIPKARREAARVVLGVPAVTGFVKADIRARKAQEASVSGLLDACGAGCACGESGTIGSAAEFVLAIA